MQNPRHKLDGVFIRESVDSLCRDGADVQYVQYLIKQNWFILQLQSNVKTMQG